MLLNTLAFTVNAPQKRVFELLSNPQNIPRWNSQSDEVVIVSGNKPAEGMVFDAGMKGSLSRYHITRLEPYSLIRFEEQGGVRFVGTISLKQVGSSRTLISYKQEAEKRLLFTLLKPIIKRSIRRYNFKDKALIIQLVEK